MKLMNQVSRRTRALVGGVLLAGVSVIAITAAPAGAQTSPPCPSGPPVLQVGNPNAGDVLTEGDYIFSGVAFDPAATEGSGIAHVDVFIGNRDNGGILLASTSPAGSRDYPRRRSPRARQHPLPRFSRRRCR